MDDERHETAGTVFEEALKRWREAISHDPDATPTKPADQSGCQVGRESPLDTSHDERETDG